MTSFHGTTILTVRKGGRVALGGDGQVSVGDTIMKATGHQGPDAEGRENSGRLRRLGGGRADAV